MWIRCLCLLALLAPVPAFADEGGPSENDLAVSTFLMPAAFVPMPEAAAELNLRRSMAAALSLGIGVQDVDTRTMSGDYRAETVLCFRVSGQFRYYALGAFDRGAYVGAETAYFYADRDPANSVSTPTDGLWLGPTLGYKYTFDFGLLLNAGMTVGLPIYRPGGLSAEEVPDPDEVPDNDVLLWPTASVGWAF